MQVTLQTLIGLGVDWEELSRRHEAFADYHDRHGWMTGETLLAWVQNGMCPPPPEIKSSRSNVKTEDFPELKKAYIRD